MIQKKICLLGAFAVGKTSLVSRYVYHAFSEKYLATVGVRIDKKSIHVNGQDIVLMVWDLAGQDEFQHVRISYLRGSSGYLLVADGTRPDTLDEALRIQQWLVGDMGPLPFVLAINKSDLAGQWQLSDAAIDDLRARDWHCLVTSAKTGDGVESAFHALAARMTTG